jgi:hypothetical protein
MSWVKKSQPVQKIAYHTLNFLTLLLVKFNGLPDKAVVYEQT